MGLGLKSKPLVPKPVRVLVLLVAAACTQTTYIPCIRGKDFNLPVEGIWEGPGSARFSCQEALALKESCTSLAPHGEARCR